ncbi:MAG: type II toxin-antitoxin system HicB family antitoxin [Dehalococcoidia bacterium]|nr:type II toxin-antitoxin system HicB family antitoxin [Dehalococcoidia bacterium]
MIKYPAIIDGELGAYGVVIPDMPGACVAMGQTVDEALTDAEEALADFMYDIKAQGRQLPDPSSVEHLELQPGEMVAFVEFREKRLVTAKEAAAELGVSDARVRQLCLSGLIVGAERRGRDWMIPSPVVRHVLPKGRRPRLSRL